MVEEIKEFDDGKEITKSYFKNKILYKKEKFDKVSGVLLLEKYYNENGNVGRSDDKPCYISYVNNSIIHVYGNNGLKHRGELKPAFIKTVNDHVLEVQYWVNGNKHNTLGPQYVKYDEHGNEISKEYFIDNVNYSEKDFKLQKRNTILNTLKDKKDND